MSYIGHKYLYARYIGLYSTVVITMVPEKGQVCITTRSSRVFVILFAVGGLIAGTGSSSDDGGYEEPVAEYTASYHDPQQSFYYYNQPLRQPLNTIPRCRSRRPGTTAAMPPQRKALVAN